MKPLEILTALLRDWPGAVAQPVIAKAVLLSGRTFKDELVRFLVREMVICGGDWRAAVKRALLCSRLPRARVMAFANWAEKVTSGADSGPFIMGVSND